MTSPERSVTSAPGALVDVPRWVLRSASRERRLTRASLAIGTAILAVVIVACFASPLLGLPSPTAQDYSAVLQPPSWGHVFGTDALGRDVFSRTLAGGRLDLAVGVALTAISLTIGVALGALAGFWGGVTDAAVMRCADIVLAIPALILILALAAVFGAGLTGVYIGVPLVGWALYARLTRAEMFVLRQKEYVLAARTLGFSRTRTLLRHALPNAWRPALVFSMADIVLSISALATLSYLGVGVQAPQPEWGALIADGQSQLLGAWWIATLPGVVLVAVSLGFVLVGDALAEIFGQELRITS